MLNLYTSLERLPTGNNNKTLGTWKSKYMFPWLNGIILTESST